ncbi:MAG: hypothetical protein P8P80_03620, partial [Crocinitomicaceae bacterium]|nr:hypothetical protein [Crocinitomicaceae bacterium]
YTILFYESLNPDIFILICFLAVQFFSFVLQNNLDFTPLFVFYFLIVFFLLYRNTIRYKAS